MSLFDKLFGKKGIKEKQNVRLNTGDIIFSLGDDLNFKIIRHLSANLKEKIRTSTLDVMTSQLYMHYWTDDFSHDDPNDQYYQNLVVYFWKSEEPFYRKSLPSVFDMYNARNFILIVNNKNVTIKHGEVSPGFGMPGMGEKYFCDTFGEKISVPDLEKIGLAEYIKSVEMTNENAEILTNKEQYFYLTDNRTTFKKNGFYIQDKLISIELAYEIGAINVVQKVIYPE